MKNAMTIDVEDYFQVSAFEHLVEKNEWDNYSPRVYENTSRMLDMFSEKGAVATFFILGWVAQKYPELIQRIHREGHEVASHGMLHQRASSQSKLEFKNDVGDAKKLLEDITGSNVIGYRAPSFSFTKDNAWVYDVLAEEGYRYSSSVYPVVHDHYGIPDAPRERYSTPSGVDEIPLSTLSFRGKNFPVSGGGYFRLYPYLFTRWAISQFKEESTPTYIFYLHPWEIDPTQPKMRNISFKTRFRHYINLKKVERRLNAMLDDFEWGAIAQIYGYDKADFS